MPEFYNLKCNECDAILKIPSDAIPGEIVNCKDCGIEYEVEFSEGLMILKVADAREDDWGE